MIWVAPAFIVIALLGPTIIGWLRLDPHVAQLADRILVSALARRRIRGGHLGHHRLFQRHRPHTRDARGNGLRRRAQRAAQPTFHFRVRLGCGGNGLGDDRRHGRRSADHAGAVYQPWYRRRVRFPQDLAREPCRTRPAVARRFPDGPVSGDRCRRTGGLPGHAGCRGRRRRSFHADRDDADVDRLPADDGLRARRHHAGRPIHRRGRQGLGQQGRQRHHQTGRRLHGFRHRVPRCHRTLADSACS